MASTGTILPGTAVTASEAPWSDNDWDNPLNIYGAGTASVTAATFDAGDQTYVLKAYNFNLSAIPDGATIDGVVCTVNGYYETAPGSIDLVQLLGTSLAKVGDNKASTPTALGSGVGGKADYPFGGTGDTWGTALTAAWVKHSNFGVALGCLAGGSGNNNVDVYLDYVVLNVYYTAGTTNITVAECAQAQVSDAAVLGVWTPITAIDDNQAQVSDLAYANYLLGAAENAQAQVSDTVTLGAIYPLTVIECNQAQASDAANVSFSSGATYNPQTGILDDFNRADENPLNPATWDGPFAAGQGLWKVVSNQAVPVG